MKSKLVSLGVVGLAATMLASAPLAARSILTIPPASAFAMKVVALHNRTRAEAGVAPIYWDHSLAQAADGYAAELARTGRWAHSAGSTRVGQGENLWKGTRGVFAVEHMIGAWASEQRLYRAGTFPQISRTGDWEQVGHYTQMIWPGSLRVGCAIRSSAREDYFVCRYSPAGNVLGVAMR